MAARGTTAAAASGVAAAPGIMAAVRIAAASPMRGPGMGLGLIDAQQDRRRIEQARGGQAGQEGAALAAEAVFGRGG